MSEAQSAIYPSLKGASVLITGGATGLGADFVRAFAAQGARVGFVDIDAEAGAALASELGTQTAFVAADLRDLDALPQIIAKLAEQLGPFTVLVNNAARDERHDFATLTPEYWRDCLATNLSHHVFAAQAVAKGMAQAGGGSIINMGSISWMRGRPGMLGYTTSKGAINGMTRSLAAELGPQGIRVNSVVPGAILTERQARLWLTPEKNAEFLEQQALKFRLEPHHVTPMVLFLASEASIGCTGQNFIVDAGLTLN
ncbi:SDR family NAD(P)-dependent oxidoreductase [Roseinatronobacter sp.]|uniref:SDR family NAD(P)-dependent oxidoreductase n=1 Tax=Roseinatronobacter sp. TaxID=1945755 RepID=UPI0025D4A600|nr:SDR family oxidoreductase [Rhodobaca sp.]